MKNVTKAQWDEAKRIFEENPGMTFLPKNRSKLPDSCFGKNSQKAENSFIKIDDKLYALASAKQEPDKAVAGEGGYGRVKYAVDEEGRRCVFKIVTDGPNYRREMPILKEFNLSTGSIIKQSKWEKKQYIQMSYLGKALPDYNCNLSIDERLRLGIEACLAVGNLHENGYSHLDIKPHNLTVDDNGRVHLVDFANVLQDLDSEMTRCATEEYGFDEKGVSTGRRIDIYSLKRTLLYPNDKRFYDLDMLRSYSVLSPGLIDKNLTETGETFAAIMAAPRLRVVYINDKDKLAGREYSNITAQTLASLLINVRYRLGFTPQQLAEPHSGETNLLSMRIVDAWKKEIHPKMYACYISVLEAQNGQPPVDNDDADDENQSSDRRSQLLHEGFRNVLRDLTGKADYLESQSPEAAKAIRSVVSSARAFDNFGPLSEDSLQFFKNSMQDVIDDVRPVLEAHRGILGKVDTLLTIMASMVIFYPAVWAYQKHHKIGHTFINTKSGKMLKELEDVKNSLDNTSISG